MMQTLYDYIEELGGTEVARLLEFTPPAISRVKRSHRRPSRRMLERAHDAWGDKFDLAGTLAEARRRCPDDANETAA